MKKLLLVLCLSLLLLIPAVSVAEQAYSLPLGQVFELTSGMQIDLDGDGSVETVKYAHKYNEETGASAYRLIAGSSQVDGEGVDMTGRIHALRLDNGADDALLLVSDYGWSDDDTTYVYSYYHGELSYLGQIFMMPWEITVNADGTLTGSARGSILHTWFRPCDLIVCTAYSAEDEAVLTNGVVEMPRDLYPMGTKVTALRDIPLCISRTNTGYARTLKAGESAWIVATDDIEWLYIVPEEYDWSEYEFASGWLRTDIGGYSATIGGESVPTYELFEGLFYAD
ncbi:MAG: hypothetical protein IJB41_04260 [Clostridia bacterium]|nr:hypothetical protein [Clostridia bacterium]